MCLQPGAGGGWDSIHFPEGAGDRGLQWRGWAAWREPSCAGAAGLRARRRGAVGVSRVLAAAFTPHPSANEWSVHATSYVADLPDTPSNAVTLLVFR